jgi:hypothetical protein
MKESSPEFAVNREVLMKYFKPKIGKSTFYDLVQRGKIAEVHGLRGYYRLNESLRRLGLPAVDQLPSDERTSDGLSDRALVDIALSICMPDELPVPSELLAHALTADEVLKVGSLQRAYSVALSDIHDRRARLNFAQGVRDAGMTMESEGVKIPGFAETVVSSPPASSISGKP